MAASNIRESSERSISEQEKDDANIQQTEIHEMDMSSNDIFKCNRIGHVF